MSAQKSPMDRSRRTGDRALVVLILGICFFMPPLAHIFQVDRMLFGIPATLVYLFAIWALLIIVTARLAPRMRNGDTDRNTDV